MDRLARQPSGLASEQEPAGAGGTESPRQTEPEPGTTPTDAERAEAEQDRQIETGEENPS